MSRAKGAVTPMMEQYHRIKSQHPGRILLYRMGDFYETFYDDAVVASKVLGITLTARGKSQGDPIPLAGVPFHSVNTYINRLIHAGYSIAICEQTEDPAQAKGVVKREVTEVITPGTVAIEECLPQNQGTYCLSLVIRDDCVGYALGDISTGEFLAGQEHPAAALGLPARFRVKEIIYPEGAEEAHVLEELMQLYPQLHYAPRRAWDFLPEEAETTVARHFGVNRSELLGMRDDEQPLLGACGALLGYFHELKSSNLAYLDRITFLREEENMVLDRVTVENLELMRPLRGDDLDATLFSQMNRCRTSMGARMLSRWMLAPLLEIGAIRERQEAVGGLIADPALKDDLTGLLRNTADLERLVGRLSGTSTRPRDLRALADTLELLPDYKRLTEGRPETLLADLGGRIDTLTGLCDLLRRAIVEDPPAKLSDGGFMADGYDEELDRLRSLTSDGRSWILGMQEKERERSGIPKLKVGYNKVFGYFLEVSRGQIDKVPEDYIAKQTLTNSTRYITPELKSREEEILGAEEKLKKRELHLFEVLRQVAFDSHQAIQDNARLIASLDVLRSLAELAERQRYCCPEIIEEPTLQITDGRHPVVESLLDGDFIPNDIELDTRREQIMLLTGPNMGGKSTYLRQTALIVLMAQMGSYVPARAARVGITDKIFTRVGASDNLARGQSTFLIEMEETATILRNMTDRSLVIMDEIGRGTSTYDGLSLAWAVLERVHGDDEPAPRTLFATHYHELTRLERDLTRLGNHHVTVKEWQEEIIFLRKIKRGPAGRSYGIHVARLAGLPREVTERAFQLLQWIEQNQTIEERVPSGNAPQRMQMELFGQNPHPLLEEIRELDIEKLTPLDALGILSNYRARLKSEE
ncbi:MAG: DNA mismatch repair protein MutS [bacterium]|nr:DNA mismatch repair protein MutS [bacterium]